MSRRAARVATLPLILAPLLLGGCEIGHKETKQTGYRGAGLDQIINPKHVAQSAFIPAAAYDVPPDGTDKASAVYQNVQVLGDLSAERFNHLMAQISQWVAPPEQGCTYCHNPENMASDEKYTKIVARKMLLMTRTINTRWVSHVQGVGVTCWTCHRGNVIPRYRWAIAEGTPDPTTIVGNKHGQNSPNANVGYASLPSDPFARYLRNGDTDQIRVASSSEYPNAAIHHASIKDAEATYGLMMHISQSLGVNCTYCHNTQSFRSWSLSRAQRATAYYGIRMVRGLNDAYITPLTAVFPANRKGPHGDPYKINCMTCHQGLAKPLNGVSMRDQAPQLWMAAQNAPPAAGTMPEAIAPGAPVTTTAAPAAVRQAFQHPAVLTGHR